MVPPLPGGYGTARGLGRLEFGRQYSPGRGHDESRGPSRARAPCATLFDRPPHGGPLAMKTYVATPATRERNWLVIDASGKTLGRLATQIADVLRGKRKPNYTPHVDVGDFVIVVNAEKVAVTGNKREDKRYWRHSGYPGGIRSRTLGELLEQRPEEVIRRAVKGMLPRNRLARRQLRKLKVYAGPEHPHQAQKPSELEIVTRGRSEGSAEERPD